jgi:hypothetical protein
MRRAAFAQMAKAVVLKMGSYDEDDRRDQQPYFVLMKKLFGNEEQNTNSKKNGRQPLLVVFDKTMVE